MTDIVDQLKKWPASDKPGDTLSSDFVSAMLQDAAAEIIRLRELASNYGTKIRHRCACKIDDDGEFVSMCMAHQAMAAEKDAEILRLRASLAATPDMAEALDDLLMALDLPGDHCELEPAKQRARAALAKAKGAGA